MRVLLVHPKQEGTRFRTPHLGLALLAAVLKRAGHEVRCLDEALRDEIHRLPPVEEVVRAFQPDVVGFSLYTAAVSAARALARRVKAMRDVPLIAGGAHASLYPDRVLADGCFDIVVAGEAENVVLDVVADPAKHWRRVVRGEPADVSALPVPDYASFLGHERIYVHPLMTSRGCPFNCSFCCVHSIGSKQWRRRPLEACFEEMDAVRQSLPSLRWVEIHDDCPSGDPERFKELLRQFLARGYGLPVWVANIRADAVDDELAELLKEAGSGSICIAAEHGNPEVFRMIGKGESLPDIERAAEIIHRHGLGLRLCFVIGLPGDSLARTADSVRLARKLRPSLIYWNMAHPFPGTRMRQWFEEHGGVFYCDDDHASYRCPTVACEEPVVETPEFTRAERRQAKFLAAVETDQYDLRETGLLPLLRQALRFGYTWKAARSVARKLLGRSLGRGAKTDPASRRTRGPSSGGALRGT
ncbi:MAG: B12-binding domain-containing radical SAM protein [Planctomycetes bacterium]|nr:B12-binding domain-containing radical SAM protein [Planctomycetota bacterium]